MTDFSRSEEASVILSNMEDAEASDFNSFDDLFNYCFNSSEYVIGTYEAAQALNNFKPDENDPIDSSQLVDGSFGAIGLVQKYEQDEFGEVNTDLSDPEKVADMVAYIRGESLFNDILNDLNLDMDSDPNDTDDVESSDNNWTLFMNELKEIVD